MASGLIRFMVNSLFMSRAQRRAAGLVATRLRRSLSALLVGCAWMLSGCATAPTGSDQAQAIKLLEGMPSQTRVIRSLEGTPVEITRISVPFAGIPGHGNAQVGAGFVWATTSSPLGLHKTVRIDAKSFQVAELSRPYTFGSADLVVAEHSMWMSNDVGRYATGDLFRLDLDTNQVTATVQAVGTPFASGDGAIWVYSPQTRVLTGIDAKSNQVRTQLVTRGGPYDDYYSFGAGSIWQYAYAVDVSSWQLVRGATPPSVVRRIDPASKKVIAEIPIGPFRATDPIRYVAGAVWVMGWRSKNVAYAIRIDVDTNLVAATIPFVRRPECDAQTLPKAPAHWNNGIWVSTDRTCIQKIDLTTNQVTDVIRFVQSGQPVLAAGEGALWGFYERSVIRFGF